MKIFTDEDYGEFDIINYILKKDNQELYVNATVKVCYEITKWIGTHSCAMEDDEPDSAEIEINWVNPIITDIYDEEGDEINYKFTGDEYSEFLAYCHDMAEEKVLRGEL